MYEIWLIINTIYELALANLSWVLSTLVIWLMLMLVTQFSKKLPWSTGVKAAVVVGLIAWVIFFALVPSLTKSSFEYVNSVIDWLAVGGVAAAFAARSEKLVVNSKPSENYKKAALDAVFLCAMDNPKAIEVQGVLHCSYFS